MSSHYAKKLGKIGETIAVNYLRKQGYRLLKRNFSIPGGEIDIIANLRGNIVFFEIKTRRRPVGQFPCSNQHDLKFGQAEEQISFRQKTCLLRSARVFLAQGNFYPCSWQFDLISINLQWSGSFIPRARLIHWKNIFAE